MKCKIPTDELTAYFDGELSPADGVKMHAHIDNCRECSSVLAEMSALRDLLARFGRQEIQAPDGFREGVISALHGQGVFSNNKIPSGKLSGLTAYKKWNSFIYKGAAAAAAIMLVGSTTWALYTGSADKKMPSVAQNTEISLPSEKNNPGNTNPSNTASTPKENNNQINKETPTKTSGPAATQNSKTNPNTKVTSTPKKTPPANPQQVASSSRINQINAMFLSVDRAHYSGYFQLNSSAAENISGQIKNLAGKYNSTAIDSATGQDKVTRINVPTAYYNALYEELKNLLTNSKLIQANETTKDDLNKSYRDILGELEKVKNEEAQYTNPEGLTPEQKQALSALENKEDSLLKQLDELDAQAKTSTILIKY